MWNRDSPGPTARIQTKQNARKKNQFFLLRLWLDYISVGSWLKTPTKLRSFPRCDRESYLSASLGKEFRHYRRARCVVRIDGVVTADVDTDGVGVGGISKKC